MRKNATHAILLMFAAALLLQAGKCNAQEEKGFADEYSLMSMLIEDEYGSEFSLILIGDETEPWCLAGGLDVLRDEWPGLKSETIDSLIVSNSGATRRLTGDFRIPVTYKLVSEKEYMDILMRGGEGAGDGSAVEAGTGSAATGADMYAAVSGAAEPDWDGFDKAYPDAQGYLTFSRFGFDSERSQALVIFSNAYRCSGARVRPGTRRVAFFEKDEDAWRLIGVSGNIRAMH